MLCFCVVTCGISIRVVVLFYATSGVFHIHRMFCLQRASCRFMSRGYGVCEEFKIIYNIPWHIFHQFSIRHLVSRWGSINKSTELLQFLERISNIMFKKNVCHDEKKMGNQFSEYFLHGRKKCAITEVWCDFCF